MKKRILTLIACMMIGVLCCEMIEPAAEPCGRLISIFLARAEGRETYQAYSLPESELGETHTQGDWEYALRESDGWAVITGYRGMANEVTLPLTIAGIDVVGIADGAFAGETLRTIHVHSNILVL